ncbi:MAG: IclR family transcriptional regulator [Burkholderiaceae bacterium]|nr:IclR family transcriptional regulator [Burkholderiaceae bacterium]
MDRKETRTVERKHSAIRSRQTPGKRPALEGRIGPPTAPRGAPERTLRLLQILIEVPGPATLASIALASGLEPNTAHRLLERLVETGYARKCDATRRYSAAARALYPMSLHHPLNRLRLESREQLRHLRERHDQSVCLIVFVGHQRVIIDFVPGREPLSPLYGTWLSNPLNASAAGIVLLSNLSRDERRKLLGDEPLPAPTPHAATTYAALEAEIQALASRGYALARLSTFIGIYAVAAPIRGPQGFIGCLAFTGSVHGIDEDVLAMLGGALRDAANLISGAPPSIKAVSDFVGNHAPDGETYLNGRI